MKQPELRKLRDVCELIVDCEHKTAPTQETGYPSIRTPNIGRGRLILNDAKRVSEETFSKWTRRAVPRKGDLILAREAPVGNVAIIASNHQVCLGQRTVLIRPDRGQVDPIYLVYLLLGDKIQGKFQAYASGVTVPHLNLKDIRNLELPPLPAMSTQRKLAAILSAYDDLIENNTRRIALLEQTTRLLYREWFVHFRFPGYESVPLVDVSTHQLNANGDIGPKIESIPDGWELKRLGDIAKQVRRSVKPEKIDPKTPYIGLAHMPKKSIALSDWGIAEETQSTKLIFKQGEILFGKIRPYFHKVGVASVDGVCSTDAIVIIPKASEYYALTLACVSSEEFVEYSTLTSQGTKMPRANWKVLVEYPVLIPPQPILVQFNAVVDNIVTQIQNMIFRNKNLRRTRDLLLPRLISGQLDVSELEIITGEFSQ